MSVIDPHRKPLTRRAGARHPLPAGEREVQQALQRILAKGSPDKVILFGSRARGDARPDSDLDLLVIEEVTDPWKRVEWYERFLRRVGVEVDVKVATPREVASWRNVSNHFLTTIVREGKVLFEAADRIAEQPPATNDKADHAREWMVYADEAFGPATRELASSGAPRMICFLAQQAVEKYLKAGLAYREVEIPRTHDLVELRRRLGRGPGRIVVIGKVAWLRKYAVEGRYPKVPKGPKTTPEHAIAAVELAKSVRKQVVPYLSFKALLERC